MVSFKHWQQNIASRLGRTIAQPNLSQKKESKLRKEDFLATALECCIESNNDSSQVLDLLQQNLSQLDNELRICLKTLDFSAGEPESSKAIAAAISCFSFQLQQLFIGSKDNNLEIAIAGYKKALEYFTYHQFPEQWADINNNLSVAYWERIRGDVSENIESSIICCENALSVWAEDNDREGWALAHSNLANAYSQRIQGNREDNLEKAILCCKKALQVYKARSHPTDWSRTQINLANAYLYRLGEHRAENLEASIHHYHNALKTITRHSHPGQWALAHHNLVGAYVDRMTGNTHDNIELAIACGKKALRVYKKRDFPERWATVQNELGAAYSQRSLGNYRRNLKQSVKRFKAALTLLSRDAFPQKYIGTVTNLGYSYQGLGDALAAYQAFKEAIDTLETVRIDMDAGDSAKQKLSEKYTGLYQSMVETCVLIACKVPSYGKEAIEYVERSKARNLVDLLASRNRYPKNVTASICQHLDHLRRSIREEQQRLEKEERQILTTQLTDKGFINSHHSSTPKIPNRGHLSQLQQELDALIEQEIQIVDASFTLTQKVKPIPFQEVVGLLPNKKTALIEWYLSDDAFITFILTPGNPQASEHSTPNLRIWISDPEDFQALNDWNKSYLDTYQEQKFAWKTDLVPKLKALSKILHLDEIVGYISSECDRIILIPHRYMHLLPLHALPLQSSNSLLNRFENGVSYAPSCQLLQLTQQQQSIPDINHLIAVRASASELAYSKIEIDAITPLFSSSAVLNKRTEIEALLSQQSHTIGSNCYHFSCHGQFDLAAPLEAALVLDKTSLTLGEIFELALKRCRLVTLSACETGLTDPNNTSDEYIGLPSGFLFAGSPSVVSSLWAIDDLSTAFLMIRFYEYFSSGLAVALALNQAQLWLSDLTKSGLETWLANSNLSLTPAVRLNLQRRLHSLKDEERPFQNPYYWAAFCAIGK